MARTSRAITKWAIYAAGLIRRRAAFSDRFAPLLDLVVHERAEILDLHPILRDNGDTKRFKLVAHLRRLHRLDGGRIELVDDRLGCTFGQEDRVPRIGVDIDAPFGGRR